jgi:hypothetical protein
VHQPILGDSFSSLAVYNLRLAFFGSHLDLFIPFIYFIFDLSDRSLIPGRLQALYTYIITN